MKNRVNLKSETRVKIMYTYCTLITIVVFNHG